MGFPTQFHDRESLHHHKPSPMTPGDLRRGWRVLLVLFLAHMCSVGKGIRHDLASTKVANQRLQSKTVFSNVKEAKRLEVSSIDLLAKSQPKRRNIDPSLIAEGDLLVRLYARCTVSAPWTFVKDKVFLQPHAPELKSGQSLQSYIEIIQHYLSDEVLGGGSGYPRIHPELVEALPALERIKPRSLQIGFRLPMLSIEFSDMSEISVDDERDIVRLRRLREPPSRQVQLQQAFSTLIATQTAQQTANILPNQWAHNQVTRLSVESMQEILRGRPEQCKEKEETIDSTTMSTNQSAFISAMMPSDSITDFLCKVRRSITDHSIEGRVIARIEITSDGSLYSIASKASSESSSSSMIGVGGIVLRLIYCSETQKNPLETSRDTSAAVSSASTRVITIQRRKGRSPQEMRRLRINAQVAAQKKASRRQDSTSAEMPSSASSLASKASLASNEEMKSETITCFIRPFILEHMSNSTGSSRVSSSKHDPYTPPVTSLEIELISACAGLILSLVIQAMSHETNDKRHSIEIACKCDSKAVTKVYRQFLSSTHVSMKEDLPTDVKSTVRTLFRNVLQLVGISNETEHDTRSPSASVSMRWVAGHPERRHRSIEQWSSDDWSVWTADRLCQVAVEDGLRTHPSEVSSASPLEGLSSHATDHDGTNTEDIALQQHQTAIHRQADVLSSKKVVSLELVEVLNLWRDVR